MSSKTELSDKDTFRLLLEIINEFHSYIKSADIDSEEFKKYIEDFQKELLELIS